MGRQNWPVEKKRMDFQDDSMRYLMKITSQDNTYNYFEKEVNHVDTVWLGETKWLWHLMCHH